MPLLHALYLAIATLAIMAATARGRLHPFLALLIAATAFAYASFMSISLIGKVFGTGFGQTLNTLGLPVLAAAMIAVLAETSGAVASLTNAAARWPARARTAATVALGLAAGSGASPGGCFAVLSPLLEADPTRRRRNALTLGLAISAAQGLLLPSPVVIAATAILDADWRLVLALGLPVAAITATAGALAAARAAAPEPEPTLPTSPAPQAVTLATTLAFPAACLIPALMLIVQSIGDIPSEPLGGGGTREMILGAGRPLVLLLTGVGIMALGTRAWRNGGLSESGFTAHAIARGGPLALLLGAAGGLQALAQTSHMAELTAEKILPFGLGLAVPFLAAAIMKTLQGASLVAAITAAGMVQPLLPALGLGTSAGRALAVLAVGAGAMTVSHVNDGLFWLIADRAALRPAQALRFSLFTLFQALVALAAVCALALLA